jgi:hypothetical protein
VGDFDHHCIWLNVCIARRTYGSFLALLLSLVAACAAHGVASGASPSLPRPPPRAPLTATGIALQRASQALPHAWWPTTPALAVILVAAVALLLCVLVCCSAPARAL